MTIHTAGKRGLALFFDNAELCEAEPGADNRISQVRQIALTAFHERGIEARDVRIEEYKGKTGTMVFVYAEENMRTLIFSFGDLEDAADAVRRLGASLPADSVLYYLAETYYLVLHVGAGSSVRAEYVLGEYGRRVEGGEAFLAHLEEMGRRVLPHKASQLLARFW